MAAENNVVIRGGRDVNLVAESAGAGDSYTSKKKKEINETVRQQGTEIASGGDTTVNAGRDITAVASSVTATGNISVNAGRDVALTTATESDYHYLETKKKSGGFLSKKTTHTISEDSASREAGSLLSGNRVTVNAGDNLTVEGSDVVADQDVSLAAGNHVDVLAATSTDTSWRFKETKKSGLMGTGGIGFTIGSSKTTHDRREAGTTQSQSASTIGSTAGNVSITAGKQAHISGSDVIANRDISITGDSVVVDPGHDRRTVDEKFEQKKSGLTVALSGTVGSAINNAVTSAQETKESSDSRLKVLQATKTALSGVQAGQAAAMATATGDPNATGVSLSLTTQKSKSQQHSESDTVSGSTLNAGNNLSVVATGKNRGDNRGDIVIAGSQLKAGGNTSLDAANDVLLSGAANTQKTTGRNSSSGGGVGVSIGAGGNGAGISVFANVNAAKGSEKGNGTEWTETTTDSGKTVTINSGRDAGMQYADSGEINPVNSVAAGWINVITMGQGWKGTIAWNAAGGALTNAINGDDPLTGAITNGAGAGFGYGVGNYVVKPAANTIGKWITGGWNPKFDPTLLKYTEVKGQLGLSKEMVPSKIPSAVGNAGGSLSSEFGSSIIQKKKDAMEAGK